jgi:hypothetical protein
MKLKKRKPWKPKPLDPAKSEPDFIRIAELEHRAAFALEELVDMLDPRDCLHQPNEINAVGILAAYVEAISDEDGPDAAPCPNCGTVVGYDPHPWWGETEQRGLEHHIKQARVLLSQIRKARGEE